MVRRPAILRITPRCRLAGAVDLRAPVKWTSLRCACLQTTVKVVLCAGWMLAVRLLSGCSEDQGPERVVVSGTVTYNGKPVPEALIRFVPVQTSAVPMAGAVVTDGKYRVDIRGGVPVGTHRIEIEAYRNYPAAGRFRPTGSKGQRTVSSREVQRENATGDHASRRGVGKSPRLRPDRLIAGQSRNTLRNREKSLQMQTHLISALCTPIRDDETLTSPRWQFIWTTSGGMASPAC